MIDINKIFEQGQLIDGRYKLISPLSTAGGSADVWLAIDVNTVDETNDESMATKVAIKIYRPKNWIDIEGEYQFRKEFRKVFGCHHENIIQPTYFSIYEEMPYLVLPYCPAGSSEKLIGRVHSEKELWKYIFEVASGLAYLHEHTPQIIHQDIKPANVLIDDNGNYAITDFGISAEMGGADIEADDETGGTFAFMAPERFVEGTAPMPQSDIWAFGATLYELITGDAPFGNDGGSRQTKDTPIPPIAANVSDEVKHLIYQCLSYNPADRPTARQIVDMVLKKRYNRNKKSMMYRIVPVLIIVSAIVGYFTYRIIGERKLYASWVEQCGTTLPENIVGDWLEYRDSSLTWAAYHFSQSAQVKAALYDGIISHENGIYFISKEDSTITASNAKENKRVLFKFKVNRSEPFELAICYRRDGNIENRTLYRIISNIEIAAGDSTQVDYKSICGTNNVKDVRILNTDIAQIDPATGQILGVQSGTTFLLFTTSIGTAAVRIDVSLKQSVAELIEGVWVYVNREERDWQVSNFQANGKLDAKFYSFVFDIIQSAKGTYIVCGNSIMISGVIEDVWPLEQALVVENINDLHLTYICYNDGDFGGKFTLNRLLDTIAMKVGDTLMPKYKDIVPDYTNISVIDSDIVAVGQTGAITALSPGQTYVTVSNNWGTGVIEVNVAE